MTSIPGTDMDMEIYTLMDAESIKLPRGSNADLVVGGIVGLLNSLHIRGRLRLEGIVGKFTPDRLPHFRRIELEQRGFNMISLNKDDKQAADAEILRRIKAWSLRCPRGFLVLLASDEDYADMMCSVQRYPNIMGCILINIPGTLKSSQFKYPQEVLYDWYSDVLFGATNAEIADPKQEVGRPVVKNIRGIVWADTKEDWLGQGNKQYISNRFEELLAEYPASSVLWEKYGQQLYDFGEMGNAVEVFERAVEKVSHSTDFWLGYCKFATNHLEVRDTIRSVFERALPLVGSHFDSTPLWTLYIEYELEQEEQDWSRLAMIYTRMLENPIRDRSEFDNILNSFKELAQKKPLSELWSTEESAAAEASGTLSTDPEVLKKYVGIRENMYEKAIEFGSKIYPFEINISRSHFHVLPLKVEELKNWHDYLDFIERDGDVNQAVKLYERCVVACANYPEFWIRFVLHMEARKCMETADTALTRATKVYVKKRPEIHIFAARFKEQKGDIAGARDAYRLVYADISPGLLEAVTKHANMEHREGNLDLAFSIYEQVIDLEKGKEHSTILSLLCARFLRFSSLISRDAEKARKIVVEALDHVQPSKLLMEALIHFEMIQPAPRQIDYLEPLAEKVIKPDADNQNIASSTEREEISLMYIEFLELCGNVMSIKKAEDQHAKLFLPPRSRSEPKKRRAADFLSSDRTKMAKTYNGTPPTLPVSNAYAYSNAQHPQTWRPTQAGFAQQQQLNLCYDQHAAYGVYPAPLAPPSVPQDATYGAYPAQAAYGVYPAPRAPPSVPQDASYGAYPAQSYAPPDTQTQWSAGYAAQTRPPTQAGFAQQQQWNLYNDQKAAYGAHGVNPAGYTAPRAPASVPQVATYGAYPAQSHAPPVVALPVSNAWSNTQTQWSAGYAAYPQTRPPTKAGFTQQQQWNPYNDQQAAYGVNPAGYIAPRAPASVPQAGTYGAYLAQTYPTQGYAPPVAAVASVAAPVQQSSTTATAPQGYYNTSYY